MVGCCVRGGGSASRETVDGRARPQHVELSTAQIA